MKYIENDSAIIFRTKERYGVGSNMSKFPIKYKGIVFSSTEALYQCARFRQLPKQLYNIHKLSPMDAKKAAHRFLDDTRDDWGTYRITVMDTCLRLKLLQHSHEVLSFLHDTGDKMIVEKSHRDAFWGAKPDGRYLVGENILGLLWMIIREEVMNNDVQDYAEIEIDNSLTSTQSYNMGD